MKYPVCNIQCALCSVHHLCSVQCEVWIVQYTSCSMHFTVFSVHHNVVWFELCSAWLPCLRPFSTPSSSPSSTLGRCHQHRLTWQDLSLDCRRNSCSQCLIFAVAPNNWSQVSRGLIWVLWPCHKLCVSLSASSFANCGSRYCRSSYNWQI